MYIEPSASFKKSARKTVISIVIFAISYVLLLCLTIGITIGFSLFGFWIFSLKPMFFTGILCLGLSASGLTVLYFVVKFVFASTKIDRSDLIEITEENEPQLFEVIHEVVSKVDTQFPKKVFLNMQVNASVFYDSNFWSMFLPIRKNLLIGIGLINSLTQQELKAVLAHEFGHFSQRSMKVGSYVYNVNKIIYNMLYNNDSLNNLLEKWSHISGYSAIFISISVAIIKAIQEILQKLYTYVNKNYLALSREMEFHADEIAAHVAGSKALANSLLRIPLANHALQTVMEFYQTKMKHNIRSQNIYPEQSVVLEFLGRQYNCSTQHGLPIIELNQLARIYRSKLNLDNQWESHPSDEDRVKALHNLHIEMPDTIDAPAIHLLRDATYRGEHIAHSLFQDQFYTESPVSYSTAEFETHFNRFVSRNKLDERLNGYYDRLDFLVPTDVTITDERVVLKFDDLYDDARLEILHELEVLKNDRSLLQSIQNGEIIIKTFDYYDHKYTAEQIGFVLQHMEDRLALLEKEVDQHHRNIYHYFKQLAINEGQERQLDEIYQRYTSVQLQVEKYHTLFQELTTNGAFFFENHSIQDIEARLSDFSRREILLKEALNDLFKNPAVYEELEITEQEEIARYINETLIYFEANNYIDKNITILFDAITQLNDLSQRHLFLTKKALIDFNLRLHENALKQVVG